MYELKDSERITTKPGLEEKWAESVGNNQDGYGHGVVDATVAVCRALDGGHTPEEAENACNGLGITGFMAGCMAQWVAHFHPRGEEFRHWWNTRWGGKSAESANAKAGAVVNPAILTIG